MAGALGARDPGRLRHGRGLVIGTTAAVPAEIPGVALKAAAVYRLEVGGAIFVSLYVTAMAFALSLQNRGFTEIGGNGVRPGERGNLTNDEKQAIERRIDRRLEEVRELIGRSRAIIDDWRARGILPPEEPRRRV